MAAPPPPPGGAGGQPPGGAAVQPPLLPAQEPRTYRAFYEDASNDPFAGQYGPVMEEYAVPANAVARQPQQLASRACQSAGEGLPMSYALLCRPANAPPEESGKVVLFHKVARFPTRVGLPATPWDEQAFAFKGDMVRGQITIVRWDTAQFRQINNQLRVPNVPTADQALAAQPPVDMLGPYNDQDAGTEIVRVRRCAYVPPKYVPLFLDEELTPREAYLRVKGALTADGNQTSCEPLLHWLLAAATRPGQDQPSPLVTAYPEVPLPDPCLIEHRMLIRDRDLPALNPVSAHQGAQQVAHQIGNLVMEQRQARQEEQARQARKEAPKTPDQYWGPSLLNLLRLCQVPSSHQLPPIYAELASTPRRQQRVVLQRAIDSACDTICPGARMYVTPSLITKVMNLDWVMHNSDDLTQGINPFIVGDQSPDQLQEQQSLILLYDTMQDGGAAPALQDAQLLMSPDAAIIPMTHAQARYSITFLQVVVHVLWGPTHDGTIALRELAHDMRNHEHRLEHMPPPANTERHKIPALMVRWVQKRFAYWTEQQFSSVSNVPFPPLNLLEKMKIGDPWAPDFPVRYLTPAPAPQPPPTPRPRETEQRVPGTPAGSGNPQDGMVRNEHYDAGRFETFRQIPGIQCRPIYRSLRPDQLPKNTANQTRCLAFHVKGMCNKRCGRCADHYPSDEDPRQRTDAEQDELVAFCQQHWQATPPS